MTDGPTLVVNNTEPDAGNVLQFATEAPGLRRSNCMHKRFVISSDQVARSALRDQLMALASGLRS